MYLEVRSKKITIVSKSRIVFLHRIVAKLTSAVEFSASEDHLAIKMTVIPDNAVCCATDTVTADVRYFEESHLVTLRAFAQFSLDSD